MEKGIKRLVIDVNIWVKWAANNELVFGLRPLENLVLSYLET
jgi:hypothetical protein